tara:strand:- start:58373 stop:58582 length:210 start_codon:yes stop_codon:yes gene_type:complete
MSIEQLNPEREQSIDLIAETYYNRMKVAVDNDNPRNAEALCLEYLVDGIDPEDGNYSWMFLQHLESLFE